MDLEDGENQYEGQERQIGNFKHGPRRQKYFTHNGDVTRKDVRQKYKRKKTDSGGRQLIRKEELCRSEESS